MKKLKKIEKTAKNKSNNTEELEDRDGELDREAEELAKAMKRAECIVESFKDIKVRHEQLFLLNSLFLFYFLEQSKILYALHNLKHEILTEQMDYVKKHSHKIKQEIK